MTILESSTVDVMAAKADSDQVLLVISDHLPWDDLHEHQRLIQEKVNSYLAFVESGQLLRVESPPIPPEPQVTIRLALKHDPPEGALGFLRQVSAFLGEAGYGFEWTVG